MGQNVNLKRLFKFFEKYKYITVVIVLGFILLILPQNDKNTEGQRGEKSEFDLHSFEKRVESSLSECSGVGRCRVVLSIDSGISSVYEKEARKSMRENESGVVIENDSDVKPSILSEGSGRESPLLIKEVYPKFRGAVVICDGANKKEVEVMVIESVSALTGLSSDKISVVKMKK